MRLGPLERDVLAVINDAPDNAFGSQIFDVISQKNNTSKGSVSSVFLVCQRLENKGLLSHTVTEPEARRGGRRRKLFALTDLGRAIINNVEQDDDETLANVVKGVGFIDKGDGRYNVAIINGDDDNSVVYTTDSASEAYSVADQWASFFKVERIS